eukprot:11179059-Lingulodinium_polyedra.AAC.1
MAVACQWHGSGMALAWQWHGHWHGTGAALALAPTRPLRADRHPSLMQPHNSRRSLRSKHARVTQGTTPIYPCPADHQAALSTTDSCQAWHMASWAKAKPCLGRQPKQQHLRMLKQQGRRLAMPTSR